MLTNDSPQTALVNLFQQGARLAYDKGEFIIRPGSAPQGVYYIVDGLVKVYDITKYGEENLLVVRKPGEILGLTWAISGEDRHIIYVTLVRSELLQVSREQFTEHLQTNPDASQALLDTLTDMYQVYAERVSNLSYRTVRERLVSFLISTGKRFGKETPDGLVIDAPLRHQDIASSISATRETTGRELSLLERQGLLSSKQSVIILKDIARLRKFLE